MSNFQRVKSFFRGIATLLLALILFLFAEDSLIIISLIICLSLLFYGVRLIWYYFTMAKHMVGGKSTLYQAVILLDLGLFTASVSALDNFIVLIYLLVIYVFSGFIDIMRALEAKRVGSASWKLRLIGGIAGVVFAVLLVIIGIFAGNSSFLVYGYGISMVYSGVLRLIAAFRKTAIVYIQ